MPGGGLLAGSSDSDVPDLDLPSTSTRKKFFSKGNPRSNSLREVGPSTSSSSSIACCSPRAVLFLFLLSLVIGLGFLTVHTLRLSKELRRTTEVLAKLSILPDRLKVLEKEVYRLRLEYELKNEPDPPGGNKTATQFVSDQVDAVQREINSLKDDFKSLTTKSDDLDDRVKAVEGATNAPRKARAGQFSESRQAAISGRDAVVFKRV